MKGEVISIIGAPGVGKSFLVKQLACRQCSPAFFEGEAGIFPADVLEVLNSEQDSIERFEWILERTRKILERAHTIAAQGITVYVDGDTLQVEAWLAAEVGEHSPAVLKHWLEQHGQLRADKTIVLTASAEKILSNREARGRVSEQSDFIARRAERIQAAALELASGHPQAMILDRTELDFTDEKTLENILGFIDAIPAGTGS